MRTAEQWAEMFDQALLRAQKRPVSRAQLEHLIRERDKWCAVADAERRFIDAGFCPECGLGAASCRCQWVECGGCERLVPMFPLYANTGRLCRICEGGEYGEPGSANEPRQADGAESRPNSAGREVVGLDQV